MNTSSSFSIIMGQLAGSLPTLLVYVGGIVFAVLRWRRAPRAALLATWGLGLMLLTHVGSTAITGILLSTRPPSGIGQVMMVVSIVSNLCRAVGLGLLVAAVFANRPAQVGAFEVGPVSSAPPPLANLAPSPPPNV